MHEGPLVRQMESRGIPTEKGEKNRWIKAANALIRNIAGKIKTLLNEKPERRPTEYLHAYQSIRVASAYSQKAKVQNVKEYTSLCSFVMTHNLHTMEDIAVCSERVDTALSELKKTMDACVARKKELQD